MLQELISLAAQHATEHIYRYSSAEVLRTQGIGAHYVLSFRRAPMVKKGDSQKGYRPFGCQNVARFLTLPSADSQPDHRTYGKKEVCQMLAKI